MSVLKDFINTVGLDHTFFYQFVIITILYFTVKHLFLQKYYQDIEKRRESTKGSFSQSKETEEKIEDLKKDYSQKAQEIHKDFQEVFTTIRNSTEESFKKGRDALQNEQRKDLEDQRKQLLKNQTQEEKKLEKELPDLVQSLVNKILERV